MARLRREHVMVAQEMVARDVPVRQIARDLGVDESTVRYHVARGTDAPDGRRDRPSIMDEWQERVTAVLQRFDDPRTGGDADTAVEAAVVHGVLRREFGFTGSYQAVRRYLVRSYPAAPVQAVRRVETPPGVQAQHDWFDTVVRVARVALPIHGLLGTLSHARARFVWVSPSMDQLAWQSGHVALFRRYGGVPLWVRIDNLKTGVATGAGPTAVITRLLTSPPASVLSRSGRRWSGARPRPGEQAHFDFASVRIPCCQQHAWATRGRCTPRP
jgi:transposase